MAISDKLNYLIETKQLFKDRLNSLGAEITSSTTFRNYLTWLDTFYGEVSDKTDLSVNGVVGRTSQNTAILPSEYTQVDYIESSGRQYINTGINADTKLRTILDISFINPTNANQTMGAINIGTSNKRYHILSGSNSIAFWVNDANYGIINSASTDRHLWDLNVPEGKVILDNTTTTTIPTNIANVEMNFWLFGRNSNATQYKGTFKLWACKMYYSGILVRDFIPCYRNSDNEVGLYDLVNGVFYTNQGTGSFTYGSVVSIPNPDYPQPINNLSGDVPYKVSGKNLFNPTYEVNKQYDKNGNILNTNRYVLNNNVITIDKSNNSIGRTYFDKLNLSSGTYTWQLDVSQSGNTTTQARVVIRNWTDSTDIVSTGTNISRGKYTYTFTLNSDKTISLMFIPDQDTDGTLSLTNIQLEKNPTPTTYEPYIEPQTFNIPLGDIELCKIDTYKDKIYSSNGRFYLNKETDKVILNGTQILSKTSTGTANYYRFNVDIGRNIFTTNSTTIIAPIYCNRLIGVSRTNTFSKIEGIAPTTTTYSYKSFNLYIEELSQMTAEEANIWFSNNNTIVYYALATPTTTEITQENYPSLYNALKQIQDYLTAYKINKEFILGYSSPEIEY